MSNLTQNQINDIYKLSDEGYKSRAIGKKIGCSKSTVNNYLSKREGDVSSERHLPKVLLLDIETAPIRLYGWSLWNQNFGLNMIDSEWFILSYAAKWLGAGEKEVYYNDMRGRVDTEDDSFMLEELWNLLNEADIVLGQNSNKFDIKKINARLVMNGFQPPSSYKKVDTLLMAKAAFGFTSNKLEWLTDKLNVKFKKLKHNNYAGFDLWKGMMADEPEAWEECKEYNIHDVLSLEELYVKLAPWDKKQPNFSLYFDEPEQQCRCGSKDFIEDGYAYTSVSKFQRYRCVSCGAESRSRKNLFTKDKVDSITMNVV